MPARIDLLYSPESLTGPILGLVDVLRTANRLWRLRHPRKKGLPFCWRVVDRHGRPMTLPGWIAGDTRDTSMADPSAPFLPARTALVVPALDMRDGHHLMRLLAAADAETALIRAHAAAGGVLAACHNGPAMLAHAGVLAGRQSAFTWLLAGWFATSYPAVHLRMDRPVCVDGGLITAGALSSQTEMALALVRHFEGEQLAQMGENALIYQATRFEQSGLNLAGLDARARDSVVFKAKRWIEQHAQEGLRLEQVAAAASVSTRTLLRHFREVTGTTPLAYQQSLRIERAKQLLEVTAMPLHGVMEHCGYQDGSAFRRLFRRETGLTPSEYRERYAVRATRRWWRAHE